MQDIRGFFIKTNRKKLGYSLEALSHGICSVSYLSKVENNETKASDEIYALLFKKMNITYSDHEEASQIRDKIDLFFENFFSYHGECKDVCEELLKEEKKVQNTNVFLYYQIFKLYTQDIATPEQPFSIDFDGYECYMNNKEKFLLNLYKSLYLGEDSQWLPSDSMQVFMLKAKGNHLCKKGYYFEAYDVLQSAYQIASKLGDPIGMGDILLSLGYVSSFVDMYAMEKFYCTAVKITQNDNMKAMAYYNIGSVFLSKDLGEKALPYLLEGVEVCQNTTLRRKFNESIFIYYALRNKEEEKHAYLQKIKDSAHYELYVLMDDNDYDKNEDYTKLLKARKDTTRLFHSLYIKNCIKNRRYKDYYLEIEFVKKHHNSL